MATNPAYRLAYEDKDVVLRFPSELMDDEFSRFLDHLDIESIRRRSNVTEEQAAALAEEVKQAAWQRVRHLFEKP
ncbi:MAG TPA: hypothetical protein VF746_13755 [Longimicrobium sp.]|jgi:hypothetical protein